MSTLRKKFITVLAVLFCALLILSTVFIIPKTEKTAEANTAASSVAELVSSVDANGVHFNYTNLQKLFAKLSNGTDYGDVVSLLNTKSAYSGADLSTNGGGEYTVTFDGKQWIPAYLSRTNDTTGDIILTLWLAESSQDTGEGVKWAGQASTNSSLADDSIYPTGMYSSSYARAFLTGYSYANTPTSLSGVVTHNQKDFWKNFSAKYGSYMVSPISVNWQATEAAPEDMYLSNGTKYTGSIIPNDGCAEKLKSNNWGTNNDGNSTEKITTKGKLSSTGEYYHWGNDKIWLPSITETGATSGTATVGIWRMSVTQLQNSKNTLTRSGGSGNVGNCQYLDPSGAWNTANNISTPSTQLVGGIRPAFHLNLSEIMTLSAADVERDYNGNEQRIEGTGGIADTDPTAVNWYNDFLFDSKYVTFKYEKGSENTPQNAGKYKVTIEFTQAGKDAELKWKNPSSSSANKKEVYLTINKKPLKVTFVNNSGTTFNTSQSVTSGIESEYPVVAFPQAVVSGQIYDHDKTGANAANYPQLRIKYTGGDGYNSNDIPTAHGSYRATAELANDCNYCLAEDDASYKGYIDFTVGYYKVAVPTLAVSDGSAGSVNDFVYDGNTHSVNIPIFNTQIDSAKQTKTIKSYSDLVTITATTADTLSYDDTSHTATATNAATYTLTATLKDASAMEWDGGGSDNKPLTFTIKKAPLELSFADGGNDAGFNFVGGEWGRSTSGSVKFLVNVSGEVNGEQVDLNVYYTNKDGTGTNPASKSGNIYSIPLNLDKGTNYKLCAELDSTKSESKNYEIVLNNSVVNRIEKPFKITTSDANGFSKDDIVWGYSNPDIDGGEVQSFDTGNKVTYNGKKFTVTVKNVSDLTAAGVKVDVTYAPDSYGYDGEYSGTKVKSYTVNIRIVAYSEDYEFDDLEVSFTWSIEQATFELSTLNSVVKWGYIARGVTYAYDETAGIPYEGGGTDGSIVMVIKEGLPSWIVPKYDTVSCNESAVGDNYIARITSFTSNDDNYTISTTNADWLTRKWKIVPRTLPTDDWTQVKYENGNVTAAPTLKVSPYSPYLGYKYYDNKDCTGADLPFDKLTYDEGVTKVYYVLAYVLASDADNWILDDSGNPHGFKVGKDKDAVDITITAGGEYDGTAQEAVIALVKDVEGITLNSFEITYYKAGSDTPLGGAPKNAGSYRVVVSLKSDFADNYYIKSGEELDFEITKRVLEVPKFEGKLTYDGTVRDVATLCGLPEGWENYIDVTVAGLSGNTDTAVKNTGRYSVTFSIKDGINSTDIRNVEWNTDSSAAKTVPQVVYITVEQLVLSAKKWIENKYYSRIEFDAENAENFVVYKVYDEGGNEVDYGTVLGSVGEMFTVEVSVAAEHGDNVRIDFVSGVTARYEFFTDGGEEPTQVSLPKIADLTFNGENQTFVVDFGEFEEYIELDLSLSDVSALTQFNAGEYKVYFKIKSGQNAVWADTGDRKSIAVTFKMKVLVLEEPQVKSGERFTYSGSAQSATLNIDAAILARFMKIEGDYTATNAGDYTFTLSIDPSFAGNVVWASAAQGVDTVKTVDWTIEKARVSVKWTQSGDVPELDIPEEFKDLDVEYEIRDENGNLVTPDQMEAGKTYTVTAKLKEGSAANYEFVDDSGKSLSTATDGFGFEFKSGKSPFPWWIIALIAGLLVATIAVIIIVVKKRQTADGEDFDDYYGEDYDYDEEEEIDDFDDEDF